MADKAAESDARIISELLGWLMSERKQVIREWIKQSVFSFDSTILTLSRWYQANSDGYIESRKANGKQEE